MGKSMVKESEPGKWLNGAGLLVLGIIQIIAGLSLTFEVNPVFLAITFCGIYLFVAVLKDQYWKNFKLPKYKSS